MSASRPCWRHLKFYPRPKILAYTPPRRSSYEGPWRPEASREGRAVRGGSAFRTGPLGRCRHSARPALGPVCGSLSALSLFGGAASDQAGGELEDWGRNSRAGRSDSATFFVLRGGALLSAPHPRSRREERMKQTSGRRPRERWSALYADGCLREIVQLMCSTSQAERSLPSRRLPPLPLLRAAARTSTAPSFAAPSIPTTPGRGGMRSSESRRAADQGRRSGLRRRGVPSPFAPDPLRIIST